MTMMGSLLDAELATMNALRDDLGHVDRHGNGYGPHADAEGRYLRALDRCTGLLDALEDDELRHAGAAVLDANSWLRDQHVWRKARALTAAGEKGLPPAA